MKRFQKILLILFAVFTILPCAGLLTQKQPLPIRTDFGDFGGGGDYGGGYGGGDYGGYDYGGDYDSGSRRSGSGASISDKQMETSLIICAVLTIISMGIFIGIDLHKRMYVVYSKSSGKSKLVVGLLQFFKRFLYYLLYLPFVILFSEMIGVLFAVFPIVTGVIIAIIGVCVFFVRQNNQEEENKVNYMHQQTVRKLQALQPPVTEEQLIEWVTKVYIELQAAWQTKNLESVRQYLSPTAYRQYDKQLENYRLSQQTNIIEQIDVKEVKLREVEEQEHQTIVYMQLETMITDYVIDDRTGKVIQERGSKKARLQMKYMWKLVRAKAPSTDTISCPNCGKQLETQQTMFCPACGSKIITAGKDWYLEEIKGISKHTYKY